MTATSLRSFRKGDFIHITYGAKSNSELFFRYGFCVSSNVEPMARVTTKFASIGMI